MANYPTIPQKTRVVPTNDIITEISDAGDVRSANLAAKQVYRLTLQHPLLTLTERNTLVSFWGTNKNLVVTVDGGNGETYDCLFTNEPSEKTDNGTWFDMSVILEGNKN